MLMKKEKQASKQQKIKIVEKANHDSVALDRARIGLLWINNMTY